MEPGDIVNQLEKNPSLPSGDMERLMGYGVMGLPFKSGDILTLRRWVASSYGPDFRSVWHRSPSGDWRIFADAPLDVSCPRYFGSAATESRVAGVDIEWTGPRSFNVDVKAEGIHWEVSLESTFSTRLMNGMARVMPSFAWRSAGVLSTMARFAGPMLSAGRVGLSGNVPNGQSFLANPLRIWKVSQSRAVIEGQDLGPIGALERQSHLSDFWLPQQGLFVVGSFRAEPLDPERHSLLTSESGGTGQEQTVAS